MGQWMFPLGLVIFLLMLVALLVGAVVGVIAAALPPGGESAHWSDRLRRGAKAAMATMGITLAALTALAGLLKVLR